MLIHQALALSSRVGFLAILKLQGSVVLQEISPFDRTETPDCVETVGSPGAAATVALKWAFAMLLAVLWVGSNGLV